MGKIGNDALIRRVEQARFEHAVLTTYTLDIPFLESAVIRHLLRNGCRNAVLFADANKLASEIARLSEPGLSRDSWWYGKHYSLIPIHHSSAFHPKVAFFLGSTIEAHIGSGNLEPGGLTNNLEIYNRVVAAKNEPDTEEARVIRGVWTYLSQTISKQAPKYVHKQLQLIQNEVPWLNTSGEQGIETEAEVVLAPGTDTFGALEKKIGGDKVEKLFVVSPFFDAQLGALSRLIERLRPAKTILLVQPDKVSLPGEKLAEFKDLEMYRFDSKAYIHAKLVVAECSTKSVLLAGSHNVSAPAFDGKNFEASVIRVNGIDRRFSEALELVNKVTAENSLPTHGSTLKIREQDFSAGAANSWLASAQIDGDMVELVTLKPLDETCRLVPIRTNSALTPLSSIPVVSGNLLRFRISGIPATSSWIAVAVARGNTQSSAVPLNHVAALEKRSRPSAEREIRKQFNRFRNDINALPELLDSVSALLMAIPGGHSHKPVAHRQPKDNGPAKPPSQLSYEDFVVPYRAPAATQHSESARRSNLEVVVAAIARVLDGKELPPELSLESDDSEETIDTPDAALANKKIYAEEALAGGRLEKGKNLVAQFEYEAHNEETPENTEPIKSIEPVGEEPSDEEERLRSLQRAQYRLRQFAERFPKFLEATSQEENVSFDALEKVSAAGSLITQFLGRQIPAGHQQVELVSWETWADFNIGLFDVLSSTRTRFLARFIWADENIDLHRPTVTRFLGYVAAVETLCRQNLIEPEAASKILIGVVRICRVLGVEHGFATEQSISTQASELITLVDSGIRSTVHWCDWLEAVSKLNELDLALREKHPTAQSVFAARKDSRYEFKVGEWVWWQFVDGHIGVIVELDGSRVHVAFEPKTARKASPLYLVPLAAAQKDLGKTKRASVY